MNTEQYVKVQGPPSSVFAGVLAKLVRPTLFYDGACPLCSREVSRLAEVCAGSIHFMDVHDMDLANDEKIPLLKRLHLWLPSGQMLQGLEANLEVWRLAGGHPLVRILSLPVIHSIADVGYRFWAWARYKVRYQSTACTRCAEPSVSKPEVGNGR